MTPAQPLPEQVDVLVVGAGLTGSAAAWRLTQRGHRVAVVDRGGPANAHGSSHGSARIVRRAYPDPFWVRQTGPALEQWQELQDSSGTVLLRRTGGIDHGARRDVPAVAAALATAHVAHQTMPAHVAESRWPGLRFTGDVVFHPDAGTVDAERAVGAMLELVRRGGGSVHTDRAVEAIRVGADDAEVVIDGGTVRARRVVLAAGAWLDTLTSGLVTLPPLAVTQQQVFHFERREPHADPWPVCVHKDELNVYHLPGGRDGGPADDRKVAEHDGGATTTAAARDGLVDDRARGRIVEYVRRWLPGLIPVPRSEATCLYTSTRSEDFVLDARGPLVIGSPCSGHGAKFAPLVGSYLAELVEGRVDTTPDRFRLVAHLQGATR